MELDPPRRKFLATALCVIPLCSSRQNVLGSPVCFQNLIVFLETDGPKIEERRPSSNRRLEGSHQNRYRTHFDISKFWNVPRESRFWFLRRNCRFPAIRFVRIRPRGFIGPCAARREYWQILFEFVDCDYRLFRFVVIPSRVPCLPPAQYWSIGPNVKTSSAELFPKSI